MRLRLACGLIALLSCATGATAAVQVIGGGRAEACWRATQRGSGDLRACDEALRSEALSPRDRAATYVNRGVLRLRARRLERAVADFDRALGIQPELGEAWVNRGAARLAQRRFAEAVADLDRGLALGAAEPEKAWHNKGLALEASGDVRGAYQAYARAAALRPGWEPPLKELRRFRVERRK